VQGVGIETAAVLGAHPHRAVITEPIELAFTRLVQVAAKFVFIRTQPLVLDNRAKGRSRYQKKRPNDGHYGS
jgi:hypothetical protein